MLMASSILSHCSCWLNGELEGQFSLLPVILFKRIGSFKTKFEGFECRGSHLKESTAWLSMKYGEVCLVMERES